MSRRDKERKDSLALLGRIADSVSRPVAPPKPAAPSPPRAPVPPAARPPPPPARAPPPATVPQEDAEAERLRRRRMEERKAKLDEERLLKERRERELARSRNLEWRGGGFTDIPASIRRTGFDRQEPSLHAKIDDVLGAANEKEGRAKHRDKGRRQGGR